MKKILQKLRTFLTFILRSIISLFIAIFAIFQNHFFSNNDLVELLIIIFFTILIYYLISHLKNLKINFSRNITKYLCNNKEGITQILSLENNLNDKNLLNIKHINQIILSIKSKYGFDDKKIHKYMLETLNNTINNAINNNGVISEELEKNIKQFCYYGEFNENNATEILSKLNKYILLRKIIKGELPKTEISRNSMFNFQKNENILYSEESIKYSIIKDKIFYKGGSTGYSVRVAKGLYLRQNSYKGEPIHNKVLEYEDTGIFILTNKHIYFGGKYNKFRIVYSKILSHEPYQNGILIQKDTTNANPMFFEVSDALFICNLIIAITQQEDN